MNNTTPFTPKKQLGQHLLIDSTVISDIINYSSNLANTNVIEIGAGTGNLTKELLPLVKSLTAIEKDRESLPFLKELKSRFSNFEFMMEDALKINLSTLIKNENNAIIANLPYNIGTLLFTNWLYYSNKFDYFILMLQKEVAQRIVAKVNEDHYSRLSLFTEIFGTSEILFDVLPTSFYPKPKVTSSVIRFTPFKAPILNSSEITAFEKLTNLLFNNKRKMIRKTLKPFNIDFEALKINPEKRPEEITFEEVKALSKLIYLQ